MKKKLILVCLMVVLSGSCAFAVTPAKPYTDAADGQVLTALWLNGMFATIYSWAQTANTDITTLKSGVVGSTEVLGTIASATASSTRAVVWTGTGLDYITMTASGTLGFELDIVGASPNGNDLIKAHISGAMGNNATFSGVIGSVVTTKHSTNPDLDVSVTFPAIKQIRVIASTTASMEWKARMTTNEVNY